MSLLLICEILGLFVLLTVDDKYSLPNPEYFPQQIQMQLSKKQNVFSQFLVQFVKSKSNFEHFEKKTTLLVDGFPILQTLTDVVRQMSIDTCLRASFNSQHVRGSQTLPKRVR